MRCALLFLVVGPLAFGQLPDTDQDGCKDSKLLTRLAGCKINSCAVKDFDSADVSMKTADGFEGKTLEGQVEIVEYVCPASVSQLRVVRNAQAALKAVGFETVTDGNSSSEQRHLTMRKGSQWLSIRTDQSNEFPTYSQTAVLVKAMEQEMEATADGLGSEIDKSGHVAVYGIQFDTGKATIKPESEAVLGEIAKLLQARADLKLNIEGHTDNVGAKAANLALSGQRAAAVQVWLVAHGIAKPRLSVQGFGDSKPVGDNATDEGRAKNRRVELAKQ
jgi:OmpA-OmpF porin, OOP family